MRTNTNINPVLAARLRTGKARHVVAVEAGLNPTWWLALAR
jgi:hypothetical protein